MRTLAVFAILTVSRLAAAQVCDFPVCPTGREYTGGSTDSTGPYGSCKHCDGFPTFACSHTLAISCTGKVQERHGQALAPPAHHQFVAVAVGCCKGRGRVHRRGSQFVGRR